MKTKIEFHWQIGENVGNYKNLGRRKKRKEKKKTIENNNLYDGNPNSGSYSNTNGIMIEQKVAPHTLKIAVLPKKRKPNTIFFLSFFACKKVKKHHT